MVQIIPCFCVFCDLSMTLVCNNGTREISKSFLPDLLFVLENVLCDLCFFGRLLHSFYLLIFCFLLSYLCLHVAP